MIYRSEYVQMLKNGRKDMLKLYDNDCLVARIYYGHSEGTLNIRSRDKFKGWQEIYDWLEYKPYEFGTQIQYEAWFPYNMGSETIRNKCIEIFGFDPGPVPD